jgi:methionine-rich copper-binding protein CopC
MSFRHCARVMSWLVVVSLACLGSLVGLTGPAQAHSTLISTEPAINAKLPTLPEDVKLTFAAPLVDNPKFPANSIDVLDPMGQHINSPVNRIDGKFLSTVLTPRMLMDGIYTVRFTAVSTDGFPQQASYTFIVNSLLKKAEYGPTLPVPNGGTVQLTAAATGTAVMNGMGQKDGSAKATFAIDFATRKMCYRITTHNLTKVTGVHVHAADMKHLTTSEQIYLPIDIKSVNAAKPICTKQDGESLAKFAAYPKKFVVMVHTAAYPEGAVSGTVIDPEAEPAAPTTANLAAQESKAGGTAWWLVGVAIVLVVVVYFIARTMSKSWSGDEDSESEETETLQETHT